MKRRFDGNSTAAQVTLGLAMLPAALGISVAVHKLGPAVSVGSAGWGLVFAFVVVSICAVRFGTRR